MKVIKWFDEHFEEFILIVFLVLISCITLLQVICRNVPAFPVLTWPEELCRFLWIATVFLSLPYTIRTETMLRVTALVDIMPWKVRNIINVIVDDILIVLVGFILGALRSVEMFVIHIKHINVEPKSTIEEQTEFELESGNFDTEAIRNMGKEGDK